MKKIILCMLLFTLIVSSAGTIRPDTSPATGINLIEALSKDNDFIKMNSLSYNLIQQVEQSKSIGLIRKYHKKAITQEEKNTLLGNLGFSDESQLIAVYKSIFECRNNILGRFPELQQKKRDEMVKIISAATDKNIYSSAGKLSAAKRVTTNCWEL